MIEPASLAAHSTLVFTLRANHRLTGSCTIFGKGGWPPWIPNAPLAAFERALKEQKDSLNRARALRCTLILTMTIPDRKHSEAHSRGSRVSADFHGDREPEFKPKYPYWLVGKGGYTLELEVFKFQVWRTFRQHTAHWPVVSICFHFASGVGMIAGLVLWYRMTTAWTGSEAWVTFLIGLVLWIVVSEAGTIAARRLDWKLFGRK